MATASAKACYCDDDGTEESDVQIEIIRERGDGTQMDAGGNGCGIVINYSPGPDHEHRSCCDMMFCASGVLKYIRTGLTCCCLSEIWPIGAVLRRGTMLP